jgi:hypothetical protein
MNKGLLIALVGAVLVGAYFIFKPGTAVVSTTPGLITPSTGVAPANTTAPLSSLFASLFGTAVSGTAGAVAGTVGGTVSQAAAAACAACTVVPGATATAPAITLTAAQQNIDDAAYQAISSAPSQVALIDDPLSDTLTEPDFGLDDPSTISSPIIVENTDLSTDQFTPDEVGSYSS